MDGVDGMSGNFTLGAIVILAIVFWTVSQSATGKARTTINLLLLVLLASMILLNWAKIQPFIITGGGAHA